MRSEAFCTSSNIRERALFSKNRPNARNPKPYRDDYALHDTATEVRRLRQQGVSVLGVFVGEETELMAEQKIFGKDFAYARDIRNFSHMVGSYLRRKIEE